MLVAGITQTNPFGYNETFEMDFFAVNTEISVWNEDYRSIPNQSPDENRGPSPEATVY